MAISKIYLDTIPEYGKFIVIDEKKKNVANFQI